MPIVNRFPEVTARILAGAERGLLRASESMKFRLIGELRLPKSGRTYQRAGRTHIASAPGQSPSTDYHELESSIQVQQEGLIVAVGSDSQHAAPLEFGTSTIAPRPMWAPVAESMSVEVAETVAAEIRKIS